MRRFIPLCVTACLFVTACGSTSPIAPSSTPLAISQPAATAFAASSGTQRIGLAKKGATDIKITRGTIVTNTPIGSAVTTAVDLKGSHGFALAGTLSQEGVLPGDDCRLAPQCAPETSLAIDATWVGTDIAGTVGYDGDALTLGNDTGATFALQLTGSVTLPAQAATATVSAPASLQGVMTTSESSVAVAGSGTVTVTLVWVNWSGTGGSWRVTRTQFDF